MEKSGGMVEYQARMLRLLVYAKLDRWVVLEFETVIWVHFFPVVAYMMEPINNKINPTTMRQEWRISLLQRSFIDVG